MVLAVVILFCMILSALFLLSYRKKLNDITRFASYRIVENPDCPQQVELLKDLAKDRLGIRLQKASPSSHLFIRILEGSEAAAEYGFSLNALTLDGYTIARVGNTLFVLSPGKEGLNRGLYRLTRDFVNENGELTIALDQRITDFGRSSSVNLYVSNRSITDFSIYYHQGATSKNAANLAGYLCMLNGKIINTTTKCPDSPYIELALDSGLIDKDFEISIREDFVGITGKDQSSLDRAIVQFAGSYLNLNMAGTAEEAASDCCESIHLTPSQDSEPWIADREAIITLWNVNYSRGVFLNNNTSLKPDVMSFSDTQLYDYVRMLKFCGFNGIQVTDMCSAWAGAGGYEFVHDRLRILAEAAHSMDMKFTLWVWGSEFTGYGWVDNSVTYDPGDYDFAYQNPEVLATFEKYYSIYAELADCCDRVIAHFYDPGNLVYSEDVAYFSHMLSDKFHGVNPEIDFGVSCWIDVFDKKAFVEAMGNNITLYEAGHHDNPEDYTAFRTFCKNTGCRNGVWAWNTCEMEIDQLAQMNYNPSIIQSVYQTAARYDEIAKPSYWSEMDSYHLLNVFSLYCAGHLLMDPTRDTDELTMEVAEAFAGPEYAKDFAEILKLIETARSGESWDTYWWNSENYILKSDAYPAAEILERSENAITTLQAMIDNDFSSNTLPLPISAKELLQLIMPHLQQINAFAQFRLHLEETKTAVSDHASEEKIAEMLNTLAKPIPEYNCVIGLWGQVEARAQQELLREFCKENGLQLPVDPTFERDQKFRIYSYFVTCQKGKNEPVKQYDPFFQHGLAYGAEETRRLVSELIEEGLLIRHEDGGVYLTDWANYGYAFN